MKLSHLVTLVITAMVISACDDNTSTLGVDMMPNVDMVTSTYTTYQTKTKSYAVGDSVLARSSKSYLGRFTDPETGTIIKSDFLAQFHCAENFAFPDSILGDTVTSVKLKLYIDDYVGDSLASFKISVYPLDVVLDPEADYYTNIDPTLFYDTTKEPIAEKWYTISDRTIEDEDRWDTDYNPNIVIAMPKEVGQQIYDAYKKDPSLFTNTETWVNSGLPCSKGFYFKLDNGEGAIAYIDIAQFNIEFKYYDEDYETDTTGVVQFAATEEVIQATRFENFNLDKLLDNDDATYLKTPAGIFTEVTLPIDSFDIADTINTAALKLTRYNDKVESSFKLGIPQTLLLVRLDDYNNGFFEDYQLADGETSYITTFNSSTNTYSFSNISSLITTCINEKKNGTATENYNKVLIIPVETTYDSSTSTTSKTLVKISHDFSMTSAKLVGGNNSIDLEVIYSRFNR